MFGSVVDSGGLPADSEVAGAVWSDVEIDALISQMDEEELAGDWDTEQRESLPDLDSIPPGPFLFAILHTVNRSRLNGFDLVRLMKGRERLVSHCQAEVMADVVEVSHSAPGDADSDPDRLAEAFEYASDEIRAALGLTRRSAEYRLSFATDLMERLPRVWEMLWDGVIDFPRARVISNGTAHLTIDEARAVVDEIAERAPRLTTGQLAAWIRRLSVESNPDKAKKRYEQAREERRMWIEQTEAGTGNVHLLDIDIADAKAIGKRVNAHMFSLRKDGDTQSHDNLRADILTDLILGGDPTNNGRGILDMKVSMSTLAGLDDKAAEIPGLGPVIADVARRFADLYPRAEWRATITDHHDQVAAVVTTSRRPGQALSRWTESTQPVCSFPGCRMPAADCDWDHLLPWAQGGATTSDNGGPKCRHDHILKDHGWTHHHHNGQDIWTSPLGHTYVTEKPP